MAAKKAGELDGRLRAYAREGVDRVMIGITDVDGVLRAKVLSLDKFGAVAAGGGGMCRVMFGWDVNDDLYGASTAVNYSTGYGDTRYVVDLTTERRIPDSGGMPFYLCELAAPEGDGAAGLCPRGVWKRVEAKAASMGLAANLGFEYEFYAFAETRDSAREKGFRNLRPMDPGNFCYSGLRASAFTDFIAEFWDQMKGLGVPLDMLHTENGPGAWEAAIHWDRGVTSADKAVVFKLFTKSFFQKRGMLATFMPRWNPACPGSGGHLHQSLADARTGRGVFYDRKAYGGMSRQMRWYVGGLVKYYRSFLALSAPTINSYARTVPGSWAPTTSSWGVDNRIVAFRVIPGSSSSQRVEFRGPGADANPYLSAAASVGAGLLGIERRIEPSEETAGSAYAQVERYPPEERLAGNLRDAARDLEASVEARELFGESFVRHFAESRHWEARQYEQAVTDWQLGRYFEII